MLHGFEVFFVGKHHKPFYLICRQLNAGENFSLIETPFLKGYKLRAELTMPRALNENGEPRVDLFVFCFEDDSKVQEFNVGDIVTLTTTPIV